MTEWQSEFKDNVVAELDGLPEELHLEQAEAGEEEVLATAVVAGLTLPGSLEPTALGVVGREEGITIEIRNVWFAGSRGATVNRVVSYIMRHMFMPSETDEWPGEDQIALCGVQVDLFRSSNRTTADLMAMIVAASNDVALRTSAAVDFFDGEIVVQTFVPCEPSKVPADFESAVTTPGR